MANTGNLTEKEQKEKDTEEALNNDMNNQASFFEMRMRYMQMFIGDKGMFDTIKGMWRKANEAALLDWSTRAQESADLFKMHGRAMRKPNIALLAGGKK